MSKKYAVKYYKEEAPIIRHVSNYAELNVLLSADAIGCFMECKPHEKMPLKMHNRIAAHNVAVFTMSARQKVEGCICEEDNKLTQALCPIHRKN